MFLPEQEKPFAIDDMDDDAVTAAVSIFKRLKETGPFTIRPDTIGERHELLLRRLEARGLIELDFTTDEIEGTPVWHVGRSTARRYT